MNDIQDIYAVLLARGYARQLFHDLGEQRQEGREVRAACPLCADNGRHFCWSLDKPLWICHVTGEGGDWLKYLERYAHMDFSAALLFLAGEAGVRLQGVDRRDYDRYVRKADLLEAIQQLLRTALASSEGEPVLRYLQARGYSRQDV